MQTKTESVTSPGLRDQVPQNAEISTEVPQAAADFRTVPTDSEQFGKVRQVAERKENHTLTVRETARMFEAAGVARTERSIINWCQPNRQGISRLDGYYDPNERKYYITPQSVDAVIQEEVHRVKKSAGGSDSEPFGSSVKHVKHSSAENKSSDERKVQELEWEINNLKIANMGKDHFIELLKHERASFIEQLQTTSRTVGQLETKLRLLDEPK